MGDFAEGIKAFKKGMSEDEKTATVTPPAETKTIDHQPPERVTAQQPEGHKAG
jgi:sec-independent protein translocase protein TatA